MTPDHGPSVPPGERPDRGASPAPFPPGDQPDQGPSIPLPPSERRPDPAAEAFVTGGAYMALGLLGVVLGLVGSFAQGWFVGPVPAASIALVLINFAVARTAGWAMGNRLAAAIPVIGWSVVASLLSITRGEGDLVIPGNLSGYLFIIGGLVAGVIAVSLVPPAGDPGAWLTKTLSP